MHTVLDGRHGLREARASWCMHERVVSDGGVRLGASQAAQAMSAYSDWAPQQFDEAAAGLSDVQQPEAGAPSAGAPAAPPAEAAAGAAPAEAPDAQAAAASSSEQGGTGFVYDSNSGAASTLVACCMQRPHGTHQGLAVLCLTSLGDMLILELHHMHLRCVPPGYFYDAASGYYYDANSGMYFDSASHQWLAMDPDTGQLSAPAAHPNGASTAAQSAIGAAPYGIQPLPALEAAIDQGDVGPSGAEPPLHVVFLCAMVRAQLPRTMRWRRRSSSR